MLRKLFSILLALALVLSLAACQGNTPPAGDVDGPVSGQPDEPDEPEEPDGPIGVEPEIPPVEPDPPEPPAPTVSTLAVCGDAMGHMPQVNDAWNAELGEYDFSAILAGAAPLVSAADYAVVNLETTFAGGPNYSGYPAFNTPDAYAYGLKEAGFDLCLTANNHCMDRRFAGLCRTLDVLDEAGLAHVGTSRTQEEADNNIYVADVGGISVAFLGYTYGTNGIPLAADAPFSVNLFNIDYMTTLSQPDYDKLDADLAAARELGTDLIAVMIHWGVEYQIKENRYQDEMADYLFSHGADIILGGHSHVLQPMELRTLDDGRQGFVCYSLGNFISNQQSEYTDTTVVLTLELTKDNETGVTEVTDYSYVPMLMYHAATDRGTRHPLLNAHAELDAGVAGAELEKKLQKAIDTCHTILGPEHDAWGTETAEDAA